MVVLNPNNWHWVDKNTLPWTKDYFNEKLKDFEVKNEESSVVYKIVEINKINGDSNVSQRKGKPICYFDLNMELKLTVASDDDENDEDEDNSSDQTGTLVLPEFMHDDPDFEIKFNGLSNDLVKQVNKDFLPNLRTVLLNYQIDLLKTHSQDLQDSQ